MSSLHDFIPEPRLREHDEVTTLAAVEQAFAAARHFDLARSGFVHALFWLRTLPERIGGAEGQAKVPNLRLDMIGRSGEGFVVLEDSPQRLVVGAIGRFWQPHIEFARVDADHFASFSEPGWGKVVWQLSCEPCFDGSRLSFDLVVSATDDAGWRKLARYYQIIGPFSRFIRRRELRMIARAIDDVKGADVEQRLAGDEWIASPKLCLDHAIEIAAPPENVWPWLVQMGCRRAGWYSYDVLDNGGESSAFSVVPELQRIRVGDVLPATPEGRDGFTVLEIDAPRALVLGGLFDVELDRSLSMRAVKPEYYTHMTWSFVLEPTAQAGTRLRVRVRADYGPVNYATRLNAQLVSLAHHFMESEQLKNLKARAEGSAEPPSATPADAVEAGVGAFGIALNLVTPFLRGVRCHWGMTASEAQRSYPGDQLVSTPRWQWTHAIEVAASPDEVWPWIVQLGQDKGGFYSYQLLENIVGCDIHNAATVHSEWQATKPGDALRLHPKMPPLEIREVAPCKYLLACAGLDASPGVAFDRNSKQQHVAVSWLFFLESLANGHTRVVSRYRCDSTSDLATRIAYGPYIAESVGFVMDRRMLLGIQERAERSHKLAGVMNSRQIDVS